MSSVWNNARNLGSPAAVLRCVNDYYAGRRQPIEKFTTLLYGELHSSGLFTWVNAGHIPPLIVRSNAQVEHFSSDTSVSPLGVNSSSSWSVGEPQESWVQLGPDDLVLIVTDGVTEAPAPGLCREQFGLERLAQAAASLGPERDPACLVESILAAIRAYTGKTSFPDDITLVAFRHRG
jgi:serine phosphatase RsbU (regulator of sigma subunit)